MLGVVVAGKKSEQAERVGARHGRKTIKVPPRTHDAQMAFGPSPNWFAQTLTHSSPSSMRRAAGCRAALRRHSAVALGTTSRRVGFFAFTLQPHPIIDAVARRTRC